MHMASGLSRALSARRCLRISAAHGVYGRPPSMLPPASKNVATGGPDGSYGNGAVAGSSETPPPRPPAGGPPPVASALLLAPPGIWPAGSGAAGAPAAGGCPPAFGPPP